MRWVSSVTRVGVDVALLAEARRGCELRIETVIVAALQETSAAQFNSRTCGLADEPRTRLDIDAGIRYDPTGRVQLAQPESDLEVPLPARARREVEQIEQRARASYWALADSVNITIPSRGRSANENELTPHEAGASDDRPGRTAEVQRRVALASVSAARSQRPTRHGPCRSGLGLALRMRTTCPPAAASLLPNGRPRVQFNPGRGPHADEWVQWSLQPGAGGARRAYG